MEPSSTGNTLGRALWECYSPAPAQGAGSEPAQYLHTTLPCDHRSIRSVPFAFRKRQENSLSSQHKSQPEKAFLVVVWAHLIHPKTPFLTERIKVTLGLSATFEMVCRSTKQDSPFFLIKGRAKAQATSLAFACRGAKPKCTLTSIAGACSTFPWFQITFAIQVRNPTYLQRLSAMLSAFIHSQIYLY